MTAENEKSVFSKTAREVIEWVSSIVTALVLVTILFTYVFRIVGVDGDSMEPTLETANRVIISNLFYEPENGDIVVISQPNNKNAPLIKRIIATGGQTVRIDKLTGEVYVNGEKLIETYISGKTYELGEMTGEITVPEGHVFVMGDNREISWDSRYEDVGTIDERYILGKVHLRIWPFSEIEIFS